MTIAQYKIKKYLSDNKMSQKGVLAKVGYCYNSLQFIYKKSLPQLCNIGNYESFFDIKNDFGNEYTRGVIKSKYGDFKSACKWFTMETGESITYTSFMRWIHGTSQPAFDTMQKYCTLFDIRNDWIDTTIKELTMPKLTTAQQKIRKVWGDNISQSYDPNIGVVIETIRRVLTGYIPIRRTQLRINDYFGIDNDFISGVSRSKVRSVGQAHLSFVIDTKKRVEYSHFSRIISGYVISSKFMKDISTYFDLKNDYYI